MPLSRKVLALGISPECERTMRRAYQFLAENREMAYSREEMANALGGPEELDEALLALVRILAVSHEEIHGLDYFAWHREFDTGTWLSVRHSAA